MDKENLKEYKESLRHYKEMYRLLPVTYDEDKASDYLDKYWVPYATYKEKWKSYHESVFYLDRHLPEMVFKKDFEYISFLGGVLFDSYEFKMFIKCLQSMGEKEFIVMDDFFRVKPELSRFNLIFNYPVSITWEEISDGDYASIAVLDAVINDYYVFSKSGKWGFYSAPNYVFRGEGPQDIPLRILGFDTAYRDLFRNIFNLKQGEYCAEIRYGNLQPLIDGVEHLLATKEELQKRVPKIYRSR